MKFNAYASNDTNVFGLHIESCGHIFAKQGRKINRPNGRNDWLLFYVVKGSETFYLNGPMEAPEGSFILFKPYEPQIHVQLEEQTAEFYYIHFTADGSFDLLGLQSSTVYPVKPSATICKLFEEIMEEVQLAQPCYEELCVFKLLEVMSLLKRKVVNISISHREYQNKIAFVIQKMNREYYQNISLEDYAKMCQMSKFHFLRVFKEITGIPPLTYRNKIRIKYAKELLKDTSMPVNVICESLGYDSPSYFCDAFKKETGLSPSKFRKYAVD